MNAKNLHEDDGSMDKPKDFEDLIARQAQMEQELHSVREQLARKDVEISFLERENRQYQHITTHTLKEPLRKLHMFSNLLETESRAGNVEKATELATKVQRFARQFSDLIEDVSRFANIKPAANKFEEVNLNEIVLMVCSQVASKIQQQEAWIEKDALPIIEAVPLLMAQLFLELIRNALWFSKTDVSPLIRISSVDTIGANPGFVTISVSDNGIGIADYHLEKVFDVFERFHPENDLPGSGIGLAYCRKIAHYHGGSISAESVLGEGTSFLVNLPVRRR